MNTPLNKANNLNDLNDLNHPDKPNKFKKNTNKPNKPQHAPAIMEHWAEQLSFLFDKPVIPEYSDGKWQIYLEEKYECSYEVHMSNRFANRGSKREYIPDNYDCPGHSNAIKIEAVKKKGRWRCTAVAIIDGKAHPIDNYVANSFMKNFKFKKNRE